MFAAAAAVAVAFGSGCGGAAATAGESATAGEPAKAAGSGAGAAGAAGAAARAVGGEEALACREAAVGIERGTRSLRPPEGSVLEPVRRLCVDDRWPAAAVGCFAAMSEGDFGRCAAGLPKVPRRRLLDRIAGGAGDRIAVVEALTRLATLQVGIAECDRFVEAVARVLVCDAMTIEVRAQLGSETADFWSLPTSGLPADAQLRMADVCGRSTQALEQQAADAGCAP